MNRKLNRLFGYTSDGQLEDDEYEMDDDKYNTSDDTEYNYFCMRYQPIYEKWNKIAKTTQDRKQLQTMYQQFALF